MGRGDGRAALGHLLLRVVLVVLLVLVPMGDTWVWRRWWVRMLLEWCGTSLGSGAVVAAGPLAGDRGARVRGRGCGELERVEGGRGRKPLRLRRTSSAWSHRLWRHRMCRWSGWSARGA